MFSVGFVCHSIHTGVMMPLVTWDPWTLKLVHLGTPPNPTHMRIPPALDMNPDLFKLVHYAAHASIGKRTLGLRLKGFLVNFHLQ